MLQKSSVVSVGYWNCYRTYRNLCRVLKVSQKTSVTGGIVVDCHRRLL